MASTARGEDCRGPFPKFRGIRMGDHEFTNTRSTKRPNVKNQGTSAVVFV